MPKESTARVCGYMCGCGCGREHVCVCVALYKSKGLSHEVNNARMKRRIRRVHTLNTGYHDVIYTPYPNYHDVIHTPHPWIPCHTHTPPLGTMSYTHSTLSTPTPGRTAPSKPASGRTASGRWDRVCYEHSSRPSAVPHHARTKFGRVLEADVRGTAPKKGISEDCRAKGVSEDCGVMDPCGGSCTNSEEWRLTGRSSMGGACRHKMQTQCGVRFFILGSRQCVGPSTQGARTKTYLNSRFCGIFSKMAN